MDQRRAVQIFQTLVLGTGGVLAIASPPRDAGQFVARVAGFLALAALPLILDAASARAPARGSRRANRGYESPARHSGGIFG